MSVSGVEFLPPGFIKGMCIVRWVKWFFNNIPEVIACSAFAVVLLVAFFNVLLRYIFATSFMWVEEIAAIGFVWIIFIGAAVCYKRKMHIGIDSLVKALPQKVSLTVQIAVNFFMFFLNIWLIYLSLVFSISAWAIPTLTLQISYTYVNMAAVVGFSFIAWYAFKDCLRSIRSRKGSVDSSNAEHNTSMGENM